MHTIPQKLRSERFLGRRESMHMKAQVMEPEEVVELVPQILNLKKILVPIDFSDMSKHAFQYALRFAEQFRCEIVLLHVVEPETVIAGTSLGVDVFAQLEDDMTAAKAELACPGSKLARPSELRCVSGAQWACTQRDHQSGQGSGRRSYHDRDPRLYQLAASVHQQHG